MYLLWDDFHFSEPFTKKIFFLYNCMEAWVPKMGNMNTAMNIAAASQLNGWQFYPELELLSVCSFQCMDLFLCFFPNHAGRWIGFYAFPLGVNVYTHYLIVYIKLLLTGCFWSVFQTILCKDCWTLCIIIQGDSF